MRTLLCGLPVPRRGPGAPVGYAFAGAQIRFSCELGHQRKITSAEGLPRTSPVRFFVSVYGQEGHRCLP